MNESAINQPMELEPFGISSYTFRLEEGESEFTQTHAEFMDELRTYVNASQPISNKEAYITFKAGVTGVISKYAAELTAATPIFDARLPRIGRHEQTIPTAWGGVMFVVTSEPDDHVEKYLIVRQSSILGFEYHNRKVEKLQVAEGHAIFMKSDDKGNVTLTIAGPGDTCELPPPTPHGIIALTNTAILETSNYELDADDLLFVF